MSDIRLIVGLGNPGREYEGTRHNAGALFVEQLAQSASITLSDESKFHGRVGRGVVAGNDLRLLIPTTFMNRSGRSVAALATFFKVAPASILIAHDELDIPPGQARFKQGGGHGGHNGLRDIVPALAGQAGFFRLRIGIGHPGHASKVSGWVLSKPSQDDTTAIQSAIDESMAALPLLLAGELVKAMTRLHSFDGGSPPMIEETP